jgi:hypothetical protein
MVVGMGATVVAGWVLRFMVDGAGGVGGVGGAWFGGD